MNPLAREFLSGLEERFPDDSTSMSMSQWIEKNTRLKKAPFSFAGYEFQRQIVDDMHSNMVVTKPSQVGLSEIQLRKFLAFLKRHTGVTGIFTLPNDKMRDRLSQTRAKPLVDSEPVFNGPTIEKPVRHKGLYQIDSSFGYFTGSTEGDATSIPADLLFHDELDLTDQRMVGLFQSRLQASAYRITQRFSTPTYLGYGVDALYKASDQHRYLVRCPRCRHWQAPTLHPRFVCLPGLTVDAPEDLAELDDDAIDEIDFDDVYVRCEKCSRPLDLGDPALRQWVAAHPTRRARGYQVDPFCTGFITAPYIFDQLKLRRQQDDVKGFYNTVLGLPYNDSNARLSEEAIRTCLGSPQETEPASDEPLFLGIDAGLTCHLILASPGRVHKMLQIPHGELVEKVDQLFRQYGHHIRAGCMDRHPYTPTAEEIRDLPGFRGVVMPVAYATHADAPSLVEVKDEFGDPSHYMANRTRMIDVVARLVRLRQTEFCGYGSLGSLVVTHLRDMIRIEKPDTPPIWNKITGADHFFHALGYVHLAMRLKDVKDYRNSDPRSTVMLHGSNVMFEPVTNDKRQSQAQMIDGPLPL